MRDQVFRRWIYLALILAALLRLGFLTSGEVLPVMWDARRYACAALGLIAIVTDGVPLPAEAERADRYRFKHYYEEYIQGEQIDWQYYTPPTLTQAQDDLFFSGPLYPALLATVFYLAPIADFTFVRLAGICFDVLSVLMIMLVAARLVGRRAAVIAGVLYAIYFPFVLTSTMLLLETSTSLLILLSIYLMMRGVETERRWYFVLVGIISGLLVLHKPTAMLLGIPFVVGLYFYTRQSWSASQFLRRLIMIALPACVLFASWLTAASAKYDQITLRDPTYAGANLRQSSSIMFEGYDLDAVEKEFNQRAIYGELAHQWKGYLGLFAKKFERLWSRPYNDFKRVFIMPLQLVEWLHLSIVALGLLGLLILMMRSLSSAAWPIVICGYYTAIHLVFHSINRYAFNAMPFMIMCAAFFVVLIADKMIPSRDRRLGRIALALLLLLVGWQLQPDTINTLFGTGLSEGIVLAVLSVKTGLWMLALILLARIFLGTERSWKQAFFPVTAGLVLTLMSWGPALSRDAWSEFECRLDDPSVKAGTRLYISDLEELARRDALGVLIDLNSPSGRKNSFTVSIGDMTGSYIGGQGPLRSTFYPKPTYIEYARLESMGIEAFKQYVIIGVSPGDIQLFLDKYGYLDISVAINDSTPESNNYVTLYGKHPTPGDSVFIPTPSYSTIERYVHRGDPRIRETVKYMSDSTISYYIGRNETNVTAEQDLSPLAGMHTGRYNMFLIHFKQSGEILVY
jgi:4-amino-4-deoxy-L-arabinose transferase-like glycosyltransferase